MKESYEQLNLFISYSHNDSDYFNVLSDGLKRLAINSKKFNWSIWDDRQIYVGTFWDNEIQNNIKDCNVALLLVSIGFMSSNYIRENEFNEFKKKYEESGVLIFPMVINPCDFNQWEDLSKLQFFKPNGTDYGKSEVKDFTYGDLLKFRETNGTLIPNSNIDRYHINLFNKIESSFEEFIKRKYSNTITNSDYSSESSKQRINKLCDYPKPSSIFTGRDNELIELNNLIKNFRLIAIEGIGGTGKTQICSKYIEDYINDKTKVVWLDGSSQSNFDVFVENAGYGEVLKGENKSNLALYSGFKDLIERDEVIIFLDNFNDYEDNSFNEFISFANKYLKKSTIILITKTEPNIEGITTLNSIKIEGLNDEALEYAKKIKSSNSKYFSISDNDLDKICNAVEGHPLAIEFSMLLICYGKKVDEIISNLPEFRSMQKVENFSKRLFLDILNHPKTTIEEKELFLTCSVFNEKFTIEEISFVSNKTDVFETIIGLIDKLLIKSKDGFFYIHPLVRSFSYGMLNDKKIIHKNAASCFISNRINKIDISLEEKILYHLSESESWNDIINFIEENSRNFIKLGQLGILQETISKLKNKNINKALFDIILGDISQIKSEWDKSLEYFKIASENTDNIAIKAEGLIKYGEILFRKGNIKNSLIYFENALKFSRANSLKKEEARSLNDIGLVYYELDKLEIANKNFIDSLKIRKEINDIEGILSTKNNIANIYDNKNQYDKAIEIHKENIDLAIKSEDNIALCIYSLNLSNVLRKDNKFDEALEGINFSMNLSQKIGDKELFSSCLNSLGLVYNQLNDKKTSLKYFQESLIVREEIKDIRGIATCYNNLAAYYYQEEKNYAKSLTYFFKSLNLSKQIGIKQNEITVLNWISDLKEQIGKTEFSNISNEILNELNLDINLKDFLNEPIIRDSKKYNRNDKVKVKYIENQIIKEGKYKNFENDIIKGNCEIL